jgi:ankyrin repeat protein
MLFQYGNPDKNKLVLIVWSILWAGVFASAFSYRRQIDTRNFEKIAEGDLKTVEKWLDADSSRIHSKDKNDVTPIHAAATNADVNVIKISCSTRSGYLY